MLDGVTPVTKVDKPGGPQLEDVIRLVDMPRKQRTVLEEAGDQTAAISRLAQTGREMAEWRQYVDKRILFVEETGVQCLENIATWIKAGVFIQCCLTLMFGLLMLVR